MPSLPRFHLPHTLQHVIQRGNNREPCSVDGDDSRLYLECLHAASVLCCRAVHGEHA